MHRLDLLPSGALRPGRCQPATGGLPPEGGAVDPVAQPVPVGVVCVRIRAEGLLAGKAPTPALLAEAGAAAAGMATALVLTGRDSREDVGGAPHAPDLIFASLEELALTLA